LPTRARLPPAVSPLADSGGLWFGTSGTVVDRSHGEGKLHTHRAGNVTLATVDLTQEDHDSYYLGYANGVLWPVFHYRLDLADFDAGYIDGYRRVNRMFAHRLLPLLKPDDVIWTTTSYRWQPSCARSAAGSASASSCTSRCRPR
jgi:trehalose-6-phosphate synthase